MQKNQSQGGKGDGEEYAVFVFNAIRLLNNVRMRNSVMHAKYYYKLFQQVKPVQDGAKIENTKSNNNTNYRPKGRY